MEAVPSLLSVRRTTLRLPRLKLSKLPMAAREYLAFLEKESGARVGMVSTGPGREQTMFVDGFAAELQELTGEKAGASAKI